MADTGDILAQYGGALVFGSVFLDQLGIPLPSAPWLLAAGALAATGQTSFGGSLALAAAACLLADILWYVLGRQRGAKALTFLCGMALEPYNCVARTEGVFERYGAPGLIPAKFLPGLGTVFPAMAGAFGLRWGRFLAFDLLGSVLFGTVFLGLGWVFSGQLREVGAVVETTGTSALAAIVVFLAFYVAAKAVRVAWMARRLRVARISPEEVLEREQAGDALLVLDLRSRLELKEDPTIIRGAVYMNVGEVRRRHQELPRDRDIVLYCSCPNEITSARVALVLRERGITRVRPLLGGIAGWRQRGYPLARLEKSVAL